MLPVMRVAIDAVAGQTYFVRVRRYDKGPELLGTAAGKRPRYPKVLAGKPKTIVAELHRVAEPYLLTMARG